MGKTQIFGPKFLGVTNSVDNKLELDFVSSDTYNKVFKLWVFMKLQTPIM